MHAYNVIDDGGKGVAMCTVAASCLGQPNLVAICSIAAVEFVFRKVVL